MPRSNYLGDVFLKGMVEKATCQGGRYSEEKNKEEEKVGRDSCKEFRKFDWEKNGGYFLNSPWKGSNHSRWIIYAFLYILVSTFPRHGGGQANTRAPD